MNKLVESVLLSASDDWTGIWEVALDAREISSESSDAEIRRIAVDSLERLLSRGWVRVGDLINEAFVPWELSNAAIIRRIESEWSELARDPDIGEIGWLTTTPEGDNAARQVASRGDAARN